jgi:hypothetical protein
MTTLSLIESLRLAPAATDGVTAKLPITIPVGKPGKHDWIRVHPDMELPVSAIHLKEDRENGFYVIGRDMAGMLGAEASNFTLYPFVNRLGVLRLWPVALPDPDGRQNEWHRTAAVAAAMARKAWIRVVANMSLGGNEIITTCMAIPDPVWPDLDLEAMLKIAFADRGKIIESADHPVVKLLQGRL